MHHFISKLAVGETDDSTHSRLIKFSKGEFEGSVIEVKAKGTTLTINGSPEYEDLIGWLLASHAPDDLIFKVSGTIRSVNDQSDDLNGAGLGAKMSKAKGKERYEVKLVDKEVPAQTLKGVYSRLIGHSTLLITLKPVTGSKEWSMSTKKDYPRPSPKGDVKGPNTEFCKAVLPLTDDVMNSVISEVIPDFKSDIRKPFKQLRIANSYRITEIILPQDKDRLDFSQIRAKSKRKGVLVRKLSVDGNELAKETDFCT